MAFTLDYISNVVESKGRLMSIWTMYSAGTRRLRRITASVLTMAHLASLRRRTGGSTLNRLRRYVLQIRGRGLGKLRNLVISEYSTLALW
jgi:hypothetical protein